MLFIRLYDTYMHMLPTDQLHINKIRILLADDHPMVREQLAIRLRREADFEIAGIASSSRETLQETQATRPDILLMDPLMRDGLGFATLRQVHANFPDLVVVVLTAYVDTALNMRLQEMGIRHVLMKGIISSQLLAKLRAAGSALSHSPDG
jgi:DNA-binding NarL/FixJ family response regulator